MQIVESEDITVEDLALTLGGQGGGGNLGEVSVGVPFDIFNAGGGDHAFDGMIEVVYDFRAREVQHHLMAA